MKHFGDITKISGYDVPPVDIITSGSPCQDLSLANSSRAGLCGERSGLFMEQIRIIKEMRDGCRRANKPIRPRYMVWENVTGALSSGNPNGEDFRIILEETARVAEPTATIPRLPDGQDWSNSGAVMGDGWSLSWRVHNSQFWGKTIRDRNTGNVRQLGTPQRRRRLSLVADFNGQTAAEISFECKNMPRDPQSDKQEEKRNSPYDRATIKETSQSVVGSVASYADHNPCVIVSTPEPIMIEMGSTKHTIIEDGICVTLKARMGTGGGNVNAVIRPDGIYKLTPLECERLQGFPDNWTNIGCWQDSNGKKRQSVDSQRYRALGNSLCLPYWQWLANRICSRLRQDGFEDLTMASLFDGIGGFPLVYSRCGCRPVWASEIEEFPIAVTKFHFGIE